MMSEALYEKYVFNKKSSAVKLSRQVYGCGERSNRSGQIETVRDPDANLSIFDENCFKFYLIKYCEILGLDALLGLLGEQILGERNQESSR